MRSIPSADQPWSVLWVACCLAPNGVAAGFLPSATWHSEEADEYFSRCDPTARLPRPRLALSHQQDRGEALLRQTFVPAGVHHLGASGGSSLRSTVLYLRLKGKRKSARELGELRRNGTRLKSKKWSSIAHLINLLNY